MERKLGDKNVKTNVSNNSFVDSFAGYQIVGVIKDEKVENTILYYMTIDMNIKFKY